MKNLSDDFLSAYLATESKTLIVSKNRKRLWSVLLDLLLEFDHVCKRHGIKYQLDSGTLLGAIRHSGMVPWDDDVDVVMLRDDYEKLCSIAKKEFSKPYFFQTNETDPGSARGHAQLRNSDTTGILKSEMKAGYPMFSYNQGIFIDIFPLDDVPDDEIELLRFRKELNNIKVKINHIKVILATNQNIRWITLNPLQLLRKLRGFLYQISMRFGFDFLSRECRRLEHTAQKYNGCGMRRCGNISLNPNRPSKQLFDREIIKACRMYEFEGFSFPGPIDFDTVLTGHYGNWHEHVVGGSVHGGMLIDVDKPYTSYFKDKR